MGTDILFENHTIKEIQEIEKKLRNDIERKKEELRQMVGERYRDLMEAADTITEMKDIAESVTNYIKSIEDHCFQLQNSSLQKGILNTIEDKVAKKRRQNELLYIVASQIKILMDSPTKIWSFIESKDFVSAVSLFMLARHTHSLLLLDPVYQEHKISVQFPIFSRQWTSINHLKYVLIQNCQQILETYDIEPEDVVGPLCCNCLLSNSSLDDILLEVLVIRKNLIKSIFRPEKYAKDQVCEFVTVLQSTLKVIYILLYPEDSFPDDCKTNLLHGTLKRVISKNGPGPVTLLDLKSSEMFKFLPTAVTEFRPALNEPIMMCSPQFLQSKCSAWLIDIKNSFEAELVNLLNFVNSVRSIALIRQALIDHLIEKTFWDKLCNSLLKRSFPVWEVFLKDCFFQRIKDIINERIKSASEYCQKDVEETLHSIAFESSKSELEFERNISLYVWIETPCDIVDNVAWIPRHQRNFWNSGELSMKSMGFTPKIQSICKDLDQRMQEAVEDISTFSCLDFSNEDSPEGEKRNFAPKEFINVYTDISSTFKYLTESVQNHIFELANYVETTLSYLQAEKDDYTNSCRIVFLGHFCHAVTNLCPSINTCLSSEKLSESIESCKSSGMRYNFSSTIIKENELWKELKNKLLEVSNSAFRLWSECHIDAALRCVDSELVTCSAEGLLKTLLRWDKIEIQEESEQGNSVNSVLRIPQHVSIPLSNALFAFCCKLNNIGGYTINSEVRSQMSKHLLTGLLKIYKSKIENNLPAEEYNSRLLQVQSLQLLFDVQFLMGLITHKDNSSDLINQLSQDIINQAVSHIDPFDMDVFSSPLQQNLKKALQKSLSLFGLIASQDQISYLNSIKTSSVSTQMEHNIMLSPNSGSRFPLLPLSSRINAMSSVVEDQFHSVPKEPEAKTLQSHSSSPNLSASDIPTNPLKSTSFYDRVTAMSSSWFGN